MATLAICGQSANAKRRIELALECTHEDRLRAVEYAWNDGRLSNRAMVNMLLCELARVNSLLSDGTYYDYDRQQWVEGGAA